MAGSTTWLKWLAGLFSSLKPAPAPGTHESYLEELRVGGLLDKERRKPPGQRDEELVHALRVDYHRRQLKNRQAKAGMLARSAASFEHPSARECCAAARWVWARMAASYRARHAYYCQHIEQIKVELAAAEARRQPVLVAQPALHLDLPAALQQPPPRVDMCSVCGRWIEQMELAEQGYQVHEDFLHKQSRGRGLLPAPAATAASRGAAGRAAAAADLPAGEAAQQGQLRQQQGLQQQQQGHQQGGGDSVGGGAEGAPATPKQTPPQQQQHTSSDQEHEQRQE